MQLIFANFITREEEMCNNINKTEKTRQNQKPIEQVLNLDDDDLLRRPRVGHVAAQAVGVRRNRRAVADPGLHRCLGLGILFQFFDLDII